MSPRNTIPLSTADAGQQVRLINISGGRHITHRLTEMGLTPGTEFGIVQNAGGPLLLSVRNSRLAVGKGMAKKLLVELL